MSNTNNVITTRQSIEQKRAKYAWDCNDNIKNNKDNNIKKKHGEYSALISKIPTFIKTNGLLNTLAFLYDKGGVGHMVFDQMINWYISDYGSLYRRREDFSGKGSKEAFLEFLLDKQMEDSRLFISLTVEILALFNWFRRFTKE